MKTVKTFRANIFLGLKEGYNGKIHNIAEIYDFMRGYCDEAGFAVTVTPTKFIYTGGEEDGAIIGIINYPRFPSTPEDLTAHAVEIAWGLMYHYNQFRVSIVCDDNTYMLENETLLNKLINFL
jgi:hypothetical protein